MNQQIRGELGPEFDDLRQPLNDLRTDWAELRSWSDPRTALIHHLHDDPITPHRDPPSSSGGWPLPPLQQPATPLRQLTAGQRPPIDPDAT